MVAVFSSLDQKKLHVDFDDAQGKSALKKIYLCSHTGLVHSHKYRSFYLIQSKGLRTSML